MHRLTLAAAAALVLTAGACATPSAEKSAAGGSVESHAKDPGAKGAKGEKGKKGKKLSWLQRLAKYHRPPKEKPWVYGDVRPGKGLLGDDEDGFVLYRQGRRRIRIVGPRQAHQGQALTPDRGPVQAGVVSRSNKSGPDGNIRAPFFARPPFDRLRAGFRYAASPLLRVRVGVMRTETQLQTPSSRVGAPAPYRGGRIEGGCGHPAARRIERLSFGFKGVLL